MIPELYVPKNKNKIKEWVKDVHNSIDNYYSGYFDEFREKDFDNYNIFNGIINKEQFEYVTDTYSNSNPARLVNYPILKKVIDESTHLTLNKSDFYVKRITRIKIMFTEEFFCHDELGKFSLLPSPK